MNDQNIQKQNRRIELGISLFLLFIGLIFSITGSVMLYSSQKMKLMCTEKVSAVITDIEKSSNRSLTPHKTNGSTYKTMNIPVFTYTVNGNEYTQSSSFNTNTNTYNVGDVMDIYYNPDNPNQIFVESNSSGSFFICALFIGVGLLITVIAIVKMIKLRSRNDEVNIESPSQP